MLLGSENRNHDNRPIELPPRQLSEDLQSVKDMVARAGHDLGVQAEIVSACEWGMDQTRAAKMRDTLSLSQVEHAELLECFRRRNEQVWGSHSKTDW